MEADNRKLYELGYFLSPELNDSEILACAEKIKKCIGEAEGAVTAEIPAQKKKMGQPVKKFTFGHFGVFYFRSEPSGIENLKNNLKSEPKILRYMIVIKKPVPAAKEKSVFKAAKKPKIAEIPMPTETKPTGKTDAPTAKTEKAEPEKEKAQMEELNKKLEEILKE